MASRYLSLLDSYSATIRALQNRFKIFLKLSRTIQITHRYTRQRNITYAVETTMTDKELANLCQYLVWLRAELPEGPQAILSDGLCEDQAAELLWKFYGCTEVASEATFPVDSVIDLYEGENLYPASITQEELTTLYHRNGLREAMLDQIIRHVSNWDDEPDNQRLIEQLSAIRAGAPVNPSWGLIRHDGEPFSFTASEGWESK